MISLPYIFGFNLGFLLVLAIYAGAIFLVAKKLNFSKIKTDLLFAVLFIAPIVWFSLIVPKWHISIESKIEAANYCEVNSDCAIDYFNSFTCGSYINKNAIGAIYKDIRLYRILSLDIAGCGGIVLEKPICKNSKCIGSGEY